MMKQDSAAIKPKTIFLKDYQQPDFMVERFDMVFKIFEGRTEVTATGVYKRNGSHNRPLELNGEELELKSILLDGKTVNYDEADHLLKIHTDKNSFTLEIKNNIVPETNTALKGLYKSGDMYATQCEAHGFRRITYYQDRPDVMTAFTVRIEADKVKYPILLCNGNNIEAGDLDGGRHYVTWEDPFRKPCYLFALVAGDLECRHDTFKTMSGRKVDLNIFVRKGDVEQTKWAMDCLKKCMKWDEERFGREYDLDLFNIVAVSDFNMGAMENKSLNIFNTQLILAHPELATDLDHYRVDAVVAHEYFHNWSGNRVTCRDWFQLSLKEGFTVFREQEYCNDEYGRAIQRIDDVGELRQRQFPEDASPMAHSVRPDQYMTIDNFYTATVYDKGSEVIRMMHTLMGEEKFRKACDLYFDRFDGQAVTCEDFVVCMEEVSKVDLGQFRLWYSQAGTPQLTCKGEYDPLGQTYSFTLYQEIPDTPNQINKKPMHIPVLVGLLDKDGKDMIGTQTLFLRDSSQMFTFEGIESEPAAPSVLRNFSAPVQMDARLEREELAFLMSHDSDGFNRWEAGQKLALSFILPALYDLEKGGSFKTDSLLIAAFEQLLKSDIPEGLKARALVLPGQEYIAQLRDVIDPLLIDQVRSTIRKDLSKALFPLMHEIYEANVLKGEYQPTPRDMGMRSLKNALLGYMMEQPEKATMISKMQYDTANNMTDRVTPLALLARHDTAEKEAAFSDFYDRFKQHELVVNKWFSLQACADRKDGIDVVKRLRGHEAFTMKNPNKVRSLYGAFAAMNTTGFHNKDGSGYRLMSDLFTEYDDINPQVTARMAGIFLQWKKYADPYKGLMKQALQKIAAKDKLSPNTYEIVTKALAD